MLQLLEAALIDGAEKELDPSQPCFLNSLVDQLPSVARTDESTKWQEKLRCLLQGFSQSYLFFHMHLIFLTSLN